MCRIWRLPSKMRWWRPVSYTHLDVYKRQFYTTAFHMPLDAIIGAGTEIIPFVNSTFTFMLFCVAPFNIIKGVLTSLVVVLCYKRISILLRS